MRTVSMWATPRIERAASILRDRLVSWGEADAVRLVLCGVSSARETPEGVEFTLRDGTLYHIDVPVLPVVTHAMLVKQGACEEQLALFEEVFGEWAEVTRENMERAYDKGLLLGWLTCMMMDITHDRCYEWQVQRIIIRRRKHMNRLELDDWQVREPIFERYRLLKQAVLLRALYRAELVA